MMENIKNTPKRIKKKDLILDSAVSIFSEHGYDNTKFGQAGLKKVRLMVR